MGNLLLPGDTAECYPGKRRKLSGLQLRGEMAEIEDTLKRIEFTQGVTGTIVVNSQGIPIRTTFDNVSTARYAELVRPLTMLARSTVRSLDPENDLTFLRIRSKKDEIMIGLDNDFLVIVIQERPGVNNTANRFGTFK
ncbi:dynein light chain roadblock-type 2-like [Sphaeramia orbicularis]|nr:dynein light chain roadblock-type 2-like [Sphaeramia orbicularis]